MERKTLVNGLAGARELIDKFISDGAEEDKLDSAMQCFMSEVAVEFFHSMAEVLSLIYFDEDLGGLLKEMFNEPMSDEDREDFVADALSDSVLNHIAHVVESIVKSNMDRLVKKGTISDDDEQEGVIEPQAINGQKLSEEQLDVYAEALGVPKEILQNSTINVQSVSEEMFEQIKQQIMNKAQQPTANKKETKNDEDDPLERVLKGREDV